MKSWWLGILLELWVSKYYPGYMTIVVDSHQTAEWNIRSEDLIVCGLSPKPGSTPISYLVLPPSLDRKQTETKQNWGFFFNLWFWGLACTCRPLVWTFDFTHICLCLSVIRLVLWLHRTFLFLTSAVLNQTSKGKPVTEGIMCYTSL